MKKLILLFSSVLLLAACKNSEATKDGAAAETAASGVVEATTEQGLKSAIYETETQMPGGMGTTSSKIIFDDYGKKTRTTIKSEISFGGKSMNTNSNSLMVDGYVYTWQEGAKSGMKFKLDESKFDPKNMDFSSMSEEMRKKLNYKDEGTETVDGKECKVGSFSAEEMKGKVWMWKQIPVKMEMSVVGKTITSKLKSLEENPSLPANTFDVPADVEFKEMNLPATAAK